MFDVEIIYMLHSKNIIGLRYVAMGIFYCPFKNDHDYLFGD